MHVPGSAARKEATEVPSVFSSKWMVALEGPSTAIVTPPAPASRV